MHKLDMDRRNQTLMTDEPDRDPIAVKLLADIEAFLERYHMSARAFSEGAGQSNRFVARLRQGVEPRSSTITACYDFMAKHRKGK